MNTRLFYEQRSISNPITQMLGEQILQTRRMKAGSEATWQPDLARLCTDPRELSTPQQDRAADVGLQMLRTPHLVGTGSTWSLKKAF